MDRASAIDATGALPSRDETKMAGFVSLFADTDGYHMGGPKTSRSSR
jgi:hypothetical protein